MSEAGQPVYVSHQVREVERLHRDLFGAISVDVAGVRGGSMIRRYRDQDLDSLLAVWASASEIAHPFLTQEFLASERENIPNIYLPNAETWVFDNGGRVVGFVALLGNEVGAIFVHPSQQRRGIGRQLMDKARELRGELVVEVFKANAIGREFYDKYGFEPMAEKVHEQTGCELLRLRLPSSKREHG